MAILSEKKDVNVYQSASPNKGKEEVGLFLFSLCFGYLTLARANLIAKDTLSLTLLSKDRPGHHGYLGTFTSRLS